MQFTEGRKNIDIIYKKVQSCLSGWTTVLLPALWHAARACLLGGPLQTGDLKRLNRIINRASSATGVTLEAFDVAVQRWVGKKTRAIVHNTEHPLHSVLMSHMSSFTGRFIASRCFIERFRRPFTPAALQNLANAKVKALCVMEWLFILYNLFIYLLIDLSVICFLCSVWQPHFRRGSVMYLTVCWSV